MGLFNAMHLVKVADSDDRQARIFLLFLFLCLVAESFITNAGKFVAFELTNSQSVAILLGSVSAVAFITFGLVSGIVVDAVSRRLFATLHLIAFATLSLIFYGTYHNGFGIAP
jgi:hypothetical protein